MAEMKRFLGVNKQVMNCFILDIDADEVQSVEHFKSARILDWPHYKRLDCSDIQSITDIGCSSIQLIGRTSPANSARVTILLDGEDYLESKMFEQFDLRESYTCIPRLSRSLRGTSLPVSYLNYLVVLALVTIVVFMISCLRKRDGNSQASPQRISTKSYRLTDLPALRTSQPKHKKNSTLPREPREQATIERSWLTKNKSDPSLTLRYSLASNITSATIKTLKTAVSKDDVRRFEIVKNFSRRSSNASMVSSTLKENILSLISPSPQADVEEVTSEFLNVVMPYVESMIRPRRIQSIHLGQFRKFYLVDDPDVELRQYLYGLLVSLNQWYSEAGTNLLLGPRALLLSIIYLEKLRDDRESVEVTKMNIFVLLAVLLLIASKYAEDEMITNEYWTRASCLELDQLNDLETTLCFEMNFEFNIDPVEVKMLIKRIQGRLTIDSNAVSVISF